MGEERKNINHNTHIVLYDEVSGLCPKCFKPLMVQNGKRKIKLYEVAHIYPFSPREEEKELLKDEQRLCDDVDSEDNLIALCRDFISCSTTQEQLRVIGKCTLSKSS